MNFSNGFGNFGPCQQMWCGACYISNPEFSFFVKRLDDDSEVLQTAEDSEDVPMLRSAWGQCHKPLTDYMHARDGDNLMVPFQCEWCVFRKLRGGGSPIEGSRTDDLLLACIQRINLDAFWSRATSTVRANKDRINSGLQLSQSVGLGGPYVYDGQTIQEDLYGYEIAIQIV
jgi:hypothetical protein